MSAASAAQFIDNFYGSSQNTSARASAWKSSAHKSWTSAEFKGLQNALAEGGKAPEVNKASLGEKTKAVTSQ